ncbi:hypothetical protein EDB80DRAFT_27611 [Ilyonectria destructans]|nr:hypothetical protein EDB80DRAFT_27611 [Ilyonectria destructans]
MKTLGQEAIGQRDSSVRCEETSSKGRRREGFKGCWAASGQRASKVSRGERPRQVLSGRSGRPGDVIREVREPVRTARQQVPHHRTSSGSRIWYLASISPPTSHTRHAPRPALLSWPLHVGTLLGAFPRRSAKLYTIAASVQLQTPVCPQVTHLRPSSPPAACMDGEVSSGCMCCCRLPSWASPVLSYVIRLSDRLLVVRD